MSTTEDRNTLQTMDDDACRRLAAIFVDAKGIERQIENTRYLANRTGSMRHIETLANLIRAKELTTPQPADEVSATRSEEDA